jgi:hypothetical protein
VTAQLFYQETHQKNSGYFHLTSKKKLAFPYPMNNWKWYLNSETNHAVVKKIVETSKGLQLNLLVAKNLLSIHKVNIQIMQLTVQLYLLHLDVPQFCSISAQCPGRGYTRVKDSKTARARQWQLIRVKDNGACSNFLYLKLRFIAPYKHRTWPVASGKE